MYPNRAREVPRLLVEVEPWGRVFLRNLRDALLHRDRTSALAVAFPGAFWPDVFVRDDVPRRTLAASTLYHLALAAVLYALPAFLLLTRPLPRLLPPPHPPITYYDIGEYLPPVNTGAAPARIPQKGQPAFAKQPIISTPDNPDNLRQTIIDPVHPVTLHTEVKMPNVVLWTDRPAPPVAANAGQPRLSFPALPAVVVAPAPEAVTRSAQVDLPKMPAAAVIEPPPPDAAQRNVAEFNIGHFDPQVAAPALPLPEQRAGGIEDTGRMAALTRAAPGGSVAPPAVQPAPSASVSSPGSGVQAAGRLIALGVEPAAVTGPIPEPGGNRRGEFAAGPNGTPGAPGTPDLAGGGNGPGGTGTGARGGAGNGSGGIPSGIYVGAGPAGAPTSGVATTTPPSGAHSKAASGPGTRQVLMAAMSHPKLADVPRDVAPGASSPAGAPREGSLEDSVFGGKKYYSMILNMPNLTSAGGSWIIRFAELRDTSRPGELTAPVATVKVDPAYPNDAIRNRVEGVVVLYAVIRSDGTVGEVRVLRGVDEQLDANACEALSHWHFRPATKNGSAVDLESVVQIPFALPKQPAF